MTGDDPDLMSDEEATNFQAYLQRFPQHIEQRLVQKFYTYFPDEGPWARQFYPKHMEFFAAGAEYPERLFMAANRTGKTDGGAFEVTCHLTGIYPYWWEGRRFLEPTEWWACGTTNETTRDIVQAKLLGAHDNPGTGMIPSHLILETAPRPHGLRGSVETAYVRHSSGGKSRIGFKTYEQGRKSFEGTAKHGIWNDEEPPVDVYQEQLLRTLTTGGLIMVTFTPLQGMSEVVTGYVEPTDAAREVKIYIQAGWDDVPHLDERAKKQILATMLPYQIAARTKGEPSLGSGAIFPIPESDLIVPPRDFNAYLWPRAYGMDVGWNRTAVIWGALEVPTDILYLYDEHYMGQGEPPSHAHAIRARGDWIHGAIDPAANGRSQKDGSRLLDEYRALGLDLTPADHAVEAGLLNVWTRMITGRLKVCANCANWLREFRKYHRDEKGNIVKGNDHIMDATRYLAREFRDIMQVKPKTKNDRTDAPTRRGGTWMRS